MIKVDYIKKNYSSTTPPALAIFFATQMLTRDMFAVANLLVVIDVVDKTLFRTKSIDVVKDYQYFFRCCSPERSCPKES